MADNEMIRSFNYPIKKYEGSEATYPVPLTRKAMAFEKTAPKESSYKPEPSLKLEDYDEIIKIILNMALVIERNPKAFSRLDEEDIRTFILMFLNGIYEGNATGETFNFEGKTDILIRMNGRNIFIAECKFWTGPNGLTDTIDQLLRYVSWRDTKTAIILFNKNKDLSLVIKKIPGVVTSHPNYRRTFSGFDETTFRYAIHQKDDNDREIILTILIFDMPVD